MISKFDLDELNKSETGIPVERGCYASKNGGCFCNGSCHEIVGYINNGKFEATATEKYTGGLHNVSKPIFNQTERMKTHLGLLIQAAKDYKEYQSIGNGAKLS